METKNKSISAGVNTFAGNNNHDINLYAYDKELLQKYLQTLEENNKLKVLLRETVDKLKMANRMVNLMIEDE